MSLTPWGHYKLQAADHRKIYPNDSVTNVRTPLGIVLVTTWYNEHRDETTTFYETVVGGTCYYAKEGRSRSVRGQSIMAHRWIKSLAGGSDD